MRAALRRIAAWCARNPAWAAGAVALVVSLVAAAPAWARVGGGDSFSGGSSSSSSSSGGSDSDAELVWFLFWLCIEHPMIGIPVTLLVIVVAYMKRKGSDQAKEWSTGAQAPATQFVPATQRDARQQLERIREQDPEFSSVLFEDFLYALYAAAHEARGRGQLDSLAGYLDPQARARYSSGVHGLQGVREVKDVIVGSMRVTKVAGLGAEATAVRVSARFETNYTEVQDEGGGRKREVAKYAVEIWSLARRRGVPSKPPAKAAKIGCPSCGAALTAIRGNVCSYCKQAVDTGAFDWRVENIEVVRCEARPPALGGGGGVETGTNLPTMAAPDRQQALDALAAKDPQFSPEQLRARAAMVFKELQAAWSERDWLRVRPFVSDSLFQMQLYWIENFKKQKQRNVIDQLAVKNLEIAKVVSDKHFDAVTLRIFASCLDYVVGEDGKLIRGHKSRPTTFSEYWTFIRGTGKTGQASLEKKCPNCGAPQKISQAGTCEFCQAKITSGEFDWILSRIEQDDVYGG
ncbi:MAG TPA: TIM44-like domain-containing protein [Myxococcales bacterium]|jgi:predicted lipid-binding transport protein (Tim44 family)